MKNKNDTTMPPIGAVSLLVVFAVLCMTVFAVLSLSTVQADDRLSKALAENVSNYYDADCRAQVILARLRAGELPDEVQKNGDIYAFECPMSETQKLAVELKKKDGKFNILKWETTTAVEWNSNDSLQIWDGTFE